MSNIQLLSKSFHKELYPKPNLPEYAIIGRSNVGKSSLLNVLTNSKSAKVSNKPGRTREIFHFLINGNFYLADLPGYGYAQHSKGRRDFWERSIQDYALTRENLIAFLVLVDASIPPQKIDLEFINWLSEHALNFVIVFTKIDKEKQKEINKNISDFTDILKKDWEELPLMFQTSAIKQTGYKEIMAWMEETNKGFRIETVQDNTAE